MGFAMRPVLIFHFWEILILADHVVESFLGIHLNYLRQFWGKKEHFAEGLIKHIHELSYVRFVSTLNFQVISQSDTTKCKFCKKLCARLSISWSKFDLMILPSSSPCKILVLVRFFFCKILWASWFKTSDLIWSYAINIII